MIPELWRNVARVQLGRKTAIPGISDHDVVLTDRDFKVKINKKAPHKINL